MRSQKAAKSTSHPLPMITKYKSQNFGKNFGQKKFDHKILVTKFELQNFSYKNSVTKFQSQNLSYKILVIQSLSHSFTQSLSHSVTQSPIHSLSK